MMSVSPSCGRGFGFGDAGDAAIDRDDDIGAAGGERAERVVVEAVAFVDAIGDVEVDPCTEQSQAEQQDRGGRHAVGVVVAVDGDPPAVADGGVDQLGGSHGAGQFFRIAQAAELGIEKLAGAIAIADAAAQRAAGRRPRGCRPRAPARPRARDHTSRCANVWAWASLREVVRRKS